MFDSFYKAFEAFVIEFSARRVVAVVLLALLALSGFGAFEWYTSYFRLSRLERSVALLERLSALDLGGKLAQDEALLAIRSEITTRLKETVTRPGASSSVAIARSVALKFGAGVAPWLLFLLAYLPSVRSDPSNWSGVGGALFVGIFFGLLALLIPDTWATWTGLILYSLGHFVLVVFVILAWQAREAARTRRLSGLTGAAPVGRSGS